MDICFNRVELEVSDSSDNAQVVFTARKMLTRLGFDQVRQYLVASAISELSTNIIRYAGKGVVTLARADSGEAVGIEVIAEDHGPGIADVKKAMMENVSTGNGLGLGLPSVKRIMDEFDIRSRPGQGTRIRAVKWLDP